MAQSSRPFRTSESIEAEAFARSLVAPFLESRGFTDVHDSRKIAGTAQQQIINATSPEGVRLVMRVRLCWRWSNGRGAKRDASAAQLRARKSGSWESTLDQIMQRDLDAGVTHNLLVQADEVEVVHAALIPVRQLRPIWERQREVSKRVIAEGRMGGVHKNHAENGDSPTLWLKDTRAPGGKAVTDVLWKSRGVENVADRPVVARVLEVVDDTFDDMPADYSSLGTDGAPRVATMRSAVKRDPRVRQEVLKRSGGACERAECGASRPFAGFLDVHHILGAETSDRYWNCVALCPNCHREAHFSPDRAELNALLLEFAERFRPRLAA